ncbi:MAG: hypothetical protein U0X20_12480 [Caldilineaceae bacterium]
MTYWALVGASGVVAVMAGYGVGTELFGGTQPDEVAAKDPQATYVLRLPVTTTARIAARE